jgi:hypothetical protein
MEWGEGEGKGKGKGVGVPIGIASYCRIVVLSVSII